MRRAADRAGIPRARQRRPAPFPQLRDRAWLAGRLAAGATNAQIAAQVGSRPRSVEAALRRHGLRRPHPHRRIVVDVDELARRHYDHAVPIRVLAAEAGCSPPTLYRRLPPPPDRPPAWRLAADWALFGTTTAVARLHGVSYRRAARWLITTAITPATSSAGPARPTGPGPPSFF